MNRIESEAAHEKRKRGMYCSTCGSSVPRGRGTCDTCGSFVRLGDLVASANGTDVVGAPDANVRFAGVRTCPRCDYHGQGLPYFTRGPHMAGLIAATLFTLPWALGAGGFLYYGLRRDHRICPRCGYAWGRIGDHAWDRSARGGRPDRRTTIGGRGGGVARVWSVILFTMSAVMLTVGSIELEAILFAFGLMSAAGGVILHRAANRAREERRASMIASLQMPVIKLAAERKGRLTVTEVAASLGWPIRRAERILHSLDDGWRVSSEITDEGVIVYEFRELMLGREHPAPSTQRRATDEDAQLD